MCTIAKMLRLRAIVLLVLVCATDFCVCSKNINNNGLGLELSIPSTHVMINAAQVLSMAHNVALEQQTGMKLGCAVSPEYPWETGLYFYSSVIKVSYSHALVPT